MIATRSTDGFILVNLLRAHGNVPRLIRDTAVRHADKTSPGRLVAELRATVDSRFTAIGTVPLDRLSDVLVHSQDVAVPLVIRHDVPANDVCLDSMLLTGCSAFRHLLSGDGLQALNRGGVECAKPTPTRPAEDRRRSLTSPAPVAGCDRLRHSVALTRRQIQRSGLSSRRCMTG